VSSGRAVPPYPAMITHELVIGYPHGGKKIGTFAGHRIGSRPAGRQAADIRQSADNSGESYKVSEIRAPDVFHAVRQQQYPLRRQRLDRSLVVRHQHDRPGEPAQGR
jgi:hypothetical protein